MTTDANSDRAADIFRRIDATGISDRELHEKSGVSRGAIAAARKGESGAGTYDRLEQWVARFEEEAGLSDVPKDQVVEFVVSGNFGVSVTVRGPVSDLAALEAAALRFTRNLGDQDAK